MQLVQVYFKTWQEKAHRGEQYKTEQEQDITVQDKTRTGYKTEQDWTDNLGTNRSVHN